MAISRFGFRKIGGEPGWGPGIFEIAFLIKILKSISEKLKFYEKMGPGQDFPRILPHERGKKRPQVRARRMGWLCSLCVRTRRPRLYRDLEDLDDGGILYTHTQPLILFPDGDPLGTPSDFVS